jgi:putative phosphoesterase
MKKKIGILSDTHLHKVTRELEDIYEYYLSDVDIIVHAGDFVSADVVEFLSRNEFHGVHGNMDPLDVKEMLPRKKLIELGPLRIGLIHGWGPSAGLEDRVWAEFQNMDVIIYGHSHRAANHMREGVLLFNPGTAIGYGSSRKNTLGFLEIGDSVEGTIINI